MITTNEISAPSRKAFGLRVILRRLLLVLFGLALAWLMIEILMRAAFDFLPPKIQADIQHVQRVPWSEDTIIPQIPWVIDRDFQLRLPPGLKDSPVHWSDAKFTFNTISAWEGHRAGLRTDLPRWPLDMVAFGDSFTFCWTKVEDCWVQRLQNDYDWHVINAGIPGTGTTGQFRLMQELAKPLKPVLVVWTWYNNDVTDDYDLAHIRGETPELQGPPTADPAPEPQGFAKYSAVYLLVSNVFNPPPKSSPYKHYQFSSLNGRLMLVHTNEYIYSSHISWPANAYGWKRNVESHEAGAKLVQDELGAKILLIVMPTKEEAYGAYYAKVVGQEYVDQMGENRRMLLTQCQDRGWYCIDPLPAFQEAVKQGQTVYYAFDSHLDASGNRILEQLVHDYVIKNKLLAKN